MKIKCFTIFTFLLALAVTGCKDEKSVDSLPVVNTEVKNNMKISISLIIKKDDNLSVYLSEDGTTNFTSEPMWKDVKGSDAPQDVVFDVSEEVLPNLVRLDFGMTKDQPDIILQKVKFEYAGKTFETSGSDLALYFTPDLTKCTFDAASGTIKAVVKDGKRQFPSLYPQVAYLKPQLEKLYK